MQVKRLSFLLVLLCVLLFDRNILAYADDGSLTSTVTVNITSGAALTFSQMGIVKFDADTVIDNLVYDGVTSSEDQLLSLSGTNPVIKVNNTTKDKWQLKVSYDTFNVDGEPDEELLFALRCDDGSYNILAPSVMHTAYIAEDAEAEEVEVSWRNNTDDLLKVFLPKNRDDLAGKSISTTVYWLVQVTL